MWGRRSANGTTGLQTPNEIVTSNIPLTKTEQNVENFSFDWPIFKGA